MKDKTIFKKWWFWVAVVLILGLIGLFTQPEKETGTNITQTPQTSSNSTAGTLPTLKAEEYKNQEGLVVYKELKSKGYVVDAEFDNTALTDMNGKASSLFEPLDVNKSENRQSVDAFIVGGLDQTGDRVKLHIVKK